jgi:hypothetical protein
MLYSWISSLSLPGMAWIIILTTVLQAFNSSIAKKIVLFIAGIGNGFSDFYSNIMDSDDPDHQVFINPFPSTGTESILSANLPGRDF